MSWNSFYKERINSSYQNYFVERYKPMLDRIVEEKPLIILEEGCGIGSISKYLMTKKIECRGYDIDSEMVQLSRVNTQSPGSFYTDNILKPVNTPNLISANLAVTHGVLEHFSDIEIRQILDRYKKFHLPSIHYVPLDKYKQPSFGDERLLSADYWLDISKATEAGLFNDGYDLWFLIK